MATWTRRPFLLALFASLLFSQGRPQNPARIVVLVLRPYGFEPSAIALAPGPVRLVVLNRSGIDEVTYNLDHETRGRERSVSVSKKQLEWRESVVLSPGRYVLAVARVARLRCEITVR